MLHACKNSSDDGRKCNNRNKRIVIYGNYREQRKAQKPEGRKEGIS